MRNITVIIDAKDKPLEIPGYLLFNISNPYPKFIGDKWELVKDLTYLPKPE
jgi:hypothetical protein